MKKNILNLLRLPVKVDKLLDTTEKALKNFQFDSKLTIKKPCQDVLIAGGKRLRPLLVFICGLKNSDSALAETAALSVELIHAGSLVHDDLIDGTIVRRGKPTVHWSFGNNIAISVGDYLFAEAIRILADTGTPKMVELLIDSAFDMSRGQLEELKFNNKIDIQKEDYFSLIKGKTASLFAASCGLGAIAGELREEEVKVLISFGLNIGMAFQILDDILDLTGDNELMGKPTGNDLAEGNLTLPLIYGVQTDKRIKELISRLFSENKKNRQMIDQIVDLTVSCDAVSMAKKDAVNFTKIAQTQLESIDIKISKYLSGISKKLLERIV
jgi:heptaprenyl diphosphate synthase